MKASVIYLYLKKKNLYNYIFRKELALLLTSLDDEIDTYPNEPTNLSQIADRKTSNYR